MDYWFCVSVCLHVSVFSCERYNVQMLRASLSETPGIIRTIFFCKLVKAFGISCTKTLMSLLYNVSSLYYELN